MASVSSAARVSRSGFTCSIRRTYAPTSGWVRSCQRPPRSTSVTPRAPGAYCFCSSARAPWSSSVANCVASCNAGMSSGFSAAKKRASSTCTARSGVANRAASLSCCNSVCAASRSSCSSPMAAPSAPPRASAEPPPSVMAAPSAPPRASAEPPPSVMAAPSAPPRASAEPPPSVMAAPSAPPRASAEPPPSVMAAPSGSSSSFSPSVVKPRSFRGRAFERLGPPDVDLRVTLRLVHLDQLEPRHLQDGEKGGHHPVPVALAQVAEERGEGDALLRSQPVGDHRDAVADGEPLDEHLVRDLDLALLQHPRHQLDQPVDRQLGRFQVCRILARQRKVFPGPAHEDVAAQLRQGPDALPDVLVLLVLEQPAHQLFARIRAK